MSDINYQSSSGQTDQNSQKNKNTIIILLSIALVASWGYMLWSKTKTDQTISTQAAQITTLDADKASIQQEFDNALTRLDSLSGANTVLQEQLTEEQKVIETKKAEIRKILKEKNVTKADLAKAKTMVSDLNDKIANLEAEVARLTGENKDLTAANTTLKGEKADLQNSLGRSKEENEALQRTVDIGSTFSASSISIVSVDEKRNGREKSTSNAKKVDKLVVSFDVENRIAESGPADMYLIVTGPDGKVVSAEGNTLTTREDGNKSFTARIPVNYTKGTRQTVQFPIRGGSYKTGTYKLEIYHNGFKIGESTRALKSSLL